MNRLKYLIQNLKQKRSFCLSLIGLFLLTQCGNWSYNSIQNLNILCHLWGLSKYYHPLVSNGNVDVDSILFQTLPRFDRSMSKKELNEEISSYLEGLGEYDFDIIPEDSITSISAVSWILNHHSPLNEDNRKAILNLIGSKERGSFYSQDNTGLNPYIYNPVNETKYHDPLPNRPLRLLSLFRLWNSVNYFFAYKELMDKSIDDVLNQAIMNFKMADDTLSYHLAVRKFASQLCDSHTWNSYDPYLFSTVYRYVPEADLVYVEGKYLFKTVYGSWKDNIHPGDELLTVNGITVETLVDSLLEYNIASTEYGTRTSLSQFLLMGESDTVNVEIQRGTQTNTLRLKRITMREAYENAPETRPSQNISDSILYINIENTTVKGIDSLLHRKENYRSIIVDLRGYNPDSGLVNILIDYFGLSEWGIYSWCLPDLKYPGMYECVDIPSDSLIQDVDQSYFGDIVVLVNEFTQSYSETLAMTLRQHPNAVFIGRQTSATNGNSARISLPGGIQFTFSFMRVLWPDGSQFQRIGIIPDIEVLPTQSSVASGIDEIFERSMLYAREHH